MNYGGTFGHDTEWKSIAHASIGYGTQYGGNYGVCVSGKTAFGALGGTLGVGKNIQLKDSSPNVYMAFNLGWQNFSFEIGGMRNARNEGYYDEVQYYTEELYFIMLATYNLCLYGPFGLILGGGIKGSDRYGPAPEFTFSIGLTCRFFQNY